MPIAFGTDSLQRDLEHDRAAADLDRAIDGRGPAETHLRKLVPPEFFRSADPSVVRNVVAGTPAASSNGLAVVTLSTYPSSNVNADSAMVESAGLEILHKCRHWHRVTVRLKGVELVCEAFRRHRRPQGS